MKLTEFQSFVEENANWFRGVHPESPASLERAELQLGFPLPNSMKWLLTEWGYSGPCGIPSLVDAVNNTLRCRAAIQLPRHQMILDDRGDAGVVCLDSRNGVVVWMGAHEIERFMAGLALSDADTFEDFSAWVISCLEAEKEEMQYG
jgi:hypothetical protein